MSENGETSAGDEVQCRHQGMLNAYLEDIRQAKNQQWATGTLFSTLIGFFILNGAHSCEAKSMIMILCSILALLAAAYIALLGDDIRGYREWKRYLRGQSSEKPVPSKKRDWCCVILYALIVAALLSTGVITLGFVLFP